ncbi:ACP S-malonyltransferase [Anaeromicropila populeti]|uniref:[acyl-carrier-protein] S-malonyltransferase n=1 Tax=Anaeromicropila populeti TaxID=37658 RepID=A0A1I6ITB5_9FIRM|nr:ACP S-malonyltransferase [Anaeromicropila populeti]SFR69984.1 [acyl-carrier-protein] S-malonyltransferase [Anaeromicropila populeti]
MKKKAILFPGQGSQYIGMGKKLCSEFATGSQTFEEASDILNLDVKELAFNSSNEVLTSTENAQVAIYVAGVAQYRVLQELTGVHPHYMAGHSLGELTALTCAGAIDFKDGVKIVRKRGLCMKEAAQKGAGTMYAIGKLRVELIQEVCRQIAKPDYFVGISNYNAEEQNVISGCFEAVEEAQKRLALLGARVKQLNVSAPFHCPVMEPAAEQFAQELSKYSFHDPECIVLSNVTARPYQGKDSIAENLKMQMVNPVRWFDSMKYLAGENTKMIIDAGPGKVMKNLSENTVPTIKVYACDDVEDMIFLKAAMKNEYSLPFISRCMGLAAASKNQCSDDSTYQKGVVEPYRRLQEMQNKIESEKRTASIEEMKLGLEMLEIIFRTKKVPEDVCKINYRRLFIDTETEDIFADYVK